MAGYGLAKGMAYRNDWDKDIDRLYQRAEYAQQIRSEKERKTLFYADLLKKGHASSPRAEKELESFYEGLNKQLADFVTENPNFETDPGAMQQFLNISDQYLNNDVLRRDLQVKEEFDKLRAAQSSGELFPEEIAEQTQKYYDYISSNPGDPIEPYVFTRVKKLEFGDVIKEANEWLKGTVSTYIDPKTHMIRQRAQTSDKDIAFAASMILKDPNKRFTVEQTYNKINQELKSQNGYRSLEEYTRTSIKVGENFTDTYEGWDRVWEKSLESGSGGSSVPWAFHNVLKPISALMDAKDENGNYVDSEMSATSLDKVFSFFGLKDESTADPSKEIEVFDTSKKRTVPFNIGGAVNLRFKNVDKIVVQGRKPKIAMTVSFDVPLSSDNVPLYNVPEEWGFQASKSEVPAGILGGGFSMTKGNVTYTKGQTYTGTIYAPVIADNPRILQYDKEYLGVAHASDIAIPAANQFIDLVNKDKNIASLYNQAYTPQRNFPTTSEEMLQMNKEAGREKWIWRKWAKTGEEGYYDQDTGELYRVTPTK